MAKRVTAIMNRRDLERLAADYLPLRRCAGGRLIHRDYMCIHCGIDPSDGACAWAKIKGREP